MDELVATMMQSGFSVAVAGFLLVRMERRLEDLTLAIRELHGAILRGNVAGGASADRTDGLPVAR